MSKTVALILWELRYVIVVLVALGFWALLDWNSFIKSTYQFMLLAKSQAKDLVLKSGKEQEDWVVMRLMPLIPLKFRIFLTEPVVRKIVHWLYHKAKDKLDDGKINDSAK